MYRGALGSRGMWDFRGGRITHQSTAAARITAQPSLQYLRVINSSWAAPNDGNSIRCAPLNLRRAR